MNIITNSSLVVGSITEECNNNYPAGIVFTQFPSSGNSTEVGSYINLWVSTGSCQEGSAEGALEGETYYTGIPYVIGYELSDAVNIITNSSLVVGSITEECSDYYPVGVVFDQYPSNENIIEVGSTIALWVSTGPCSDNNDIFNSCGCGCIGNKSSLNGNQLLKYLLDFLLVGMSLLTLVGMKGYSNQKKKYIEICKEVRIKK